MQIVIIQLPLNFNELYLLTAGQLHALAYYSADIAWCPYSLTSTQQISFDYHIGYTVSADSQLLSLSCDSKRGIFRKLPRFQF